MQSYHFCEGHFDLPGVSLSFLKEKFFPYRSMQNFSARNCTTCGGSFFEQAFMPRCSSSLLNGLHQAMRVFTDTPARRANSDFNIAFIPSINF